jgi:hypothetical protein
MNREPVRRPPSVGDPGQSWRQEQSVSKEQFVAEMLSRPSNAESESGRGRPQVARPRSRRDASPAAQGRPQSAPPDVSIILCQQQKKNHHTYLVIDV